MTVLPTLDPIDGSDFPTEVADVPTRRARGTRERVAAHALVADIARQHGDALLRTARRFSACADDAHDAYQRAMELLLAHADTIDRAKAVPWLHVVVRREASAIRRAHDRNVPLDDEDVEEATSRLASQADDQLDTIDLARRAGEALAMLKESEAQALCLRAQGLSYDEIAEAYGWSYTKVNRTVTEGRRNFVAHYRAVENGLVCTDTADLVARFAAGELKPRVALKVRAHLVRCSACRALLHAEREADRSLHALLPTAAVAGGSSSGWLHEHFLGPLGHLAGRLQPAGDHLVASKLGVAAASTVALATSGIAVEHQLRSEPAPALRSALSADSSGGSDRSRSAAPATITLPAALSSARERGTKIAATERRRVAAVKRRKAAAAKRAKAAKAAANRREFGPGSGEFSGTSGSGSATGSSSGGSRSTATTAAPTAPAAEVPVTDASTGASVDVAPEAPSSSAPSSSSVSDEFGP